MKTRAERTPKKQNAGFLYSLSEKQKPAVDNYISELIGAADNFGKRTALGALAALKPMLNLRRFKKIACLPKGVKLCSASRGKSANLVITAARI